MPSKKAKRNAVLRFAYPKGTSEKYRSDLNRDSADYFPQAMSRQTNNATTGVDIEAITNQIRAYRNSARSGTTSTGAFVRVSLPNLSPPQGMGSTIAEKSLDAENRE
ncbi:MAG: hypothetical protein KGM92_04535 [Acidobacteriota bacterium]|nr:hypothetical protein [Acidobacteriota bacterium]